MKKISLFLLVSVFVLTVFAPMQSASALQFSYSKQYANRYESLHRDIISKSKVKKSAPAVITKTKVNTATAVKTPSTLSPSNQKLCKGMTWKVKQSLPDSQSVLVGWTDSSGAYKGDTDCSETLPVLCFNKNAGSTIPNDVQVASQQYVQNASGGTARSASHYVRWSKGSVALTDPVLGSTLSSLAAADSLCSQKFGTGWRMAEFHDGWGWNFWAKDSGQDLEGTTSSPARQNTFTHHKISDYKGKFWVYINDQRANPWNYLP